MMTTYVNELGEFVDGDPPDRDLNRPLAYRCCAEVDMARLRKKERIAEERREKVRVEKECPHCHKTFVPDPPYKQYCTTECQRANYNECRRKEYAAIKKRRTA